MADLDEPSEDRGRAGFGSLPGTPRWVKVSAIIVLVAVLLIAALLVLGGGEHGPGRHSSSDDGATPPAEISEGAPHERPQNGH